MGNIVLTRRMTILVILKGNEHMEKNGIKKSVLSWTLIVMMVIFQLSTSLAPAFADGETVAKQVSSWEELKAAVDNNTSVEITLADNFAAKGTIDIGNGKSVKIKGEQTIYRDRDAKFLSMFNVQNGGTVTLDKGVTLSAKSMSGGGASSCRLLKGWEQESLSGNYHEGPTQWVFIANKDGNRKSIAVENGAVVSKDANELWNAENIDKEKYKDQIFTLDFSTTHNVMNKDMYVYTAKNNASQKYLIR